MRILSFNYKNLRRSFIKPCLLSYDCIKNLINQTDLSDDDFMKEIDDKLKRKKSHLTVVITKNNKKSLNNYHSH